MTIKHKALMELRILPKKQSISHLQSGDFIGMALRYIPAEIGGSGSLSLTGYSKLSQMSVCPPCIRKRLINYVALFI